MPLLHILIERIDPSQNIAGYYVLSIEPTMFGDSALVRQPAPTASPAQPSSAFLLQSDNSCHPLEAWLQRKRRHGDRPQPGSN